MQAFEQHVQNFLKRNNYHFLNTSSIPNKSDFIVFIGMCFIMVECKNRKKFSFKSYEKEQSNQYLWLNRWHWSVLLYTAECSHFKQIKAYSFKKKKIIAKGKLKDIFNSLIDNYKILSYS